MRIKWWKYGELALEVTSSVLRVGGDVLHVLADAAEKRIPKCPHPAPEIIVEAARRAPGRAIVCSDCGTLLVEAAPAPQAAPAAAPLTAPLAADAVVAEPSSGGS